MAEAMADGAARWVRWAGGACSDEPHSRCTVSDSQAKPGSSGWWQSALESLSAAEVEKLTGIAVVAGGSFEDGALRPCTVRSGVFRDALWFRRWAACMGTVKMNGNFSLRGLLFDAWLLLSRTFHGVRRL